MLYRDADHSVKPVGKLAVNAIPWNAQAQLERLADPMRKNEYGRYLLEILRDA